MDLTAEEVIDRGGINAAARGSKPKSASEADLPGDLAEAEAEIADTKQAYYDALNRRHRALRALAQETNPVRVKKRMSMDSETRLRRALMRLSNEKTESGVKAALALAL